MAANPTFAAAKLDMCFQITANKISFQARKMLQIP